MPSFFCRSKVSLHLVPALVEFAFVLCDEFLRGVQWGMGRAQGNIGEERSAGIRLLLVANVSKSAVTQVFGQVVARTRGGIDEVVVLYQQRCPLVGLSAEEAVVLREPHTKRA